MQLKLKEIEAKTVEGPPVTEKKDVSFDVSRQVRLVPPFQEQEVDKFFLHFEKVATNLHWPVEAWPMLLQSVLVGKACEVYSSLSVEQSADYNLVKEILKAHKLVPEAYHQKSQGALKVKHTRNLQDRKKCSSTDGVHHKMLAQILRNLNN